MEQDPFVRSLEEGGAHHWLQQLVGEWQGTARTWFEPEQLGDEQPIRGTIRPLLDGRFVQHEYETTLAGYQCRGLAFYGYHLQTQRFEATWMDTCHMGTGIMFSQGDGGELSFSVLGHYPAAGQPEWGWRTTIERTGEDELLITAYNISPEGQAARAVEIRYHRLA